MKSLRNLVTESLIFPVSDLVTGSSIHSNLKFLLKSQYWTREQLEQYQTEKLLKLIGHAYRNVSFYRELMDEHKLKPQDIRSIADLSLLPIVTKEQMRKAGKKLVAANLDTMKYTLQSSSGSTGEPFQYYINNVADSVVKATSIRAWYWHGYRLGDKYVKISMNPRSSKIKQLQDWVNKCKYISSNQLTEERFRAILDEIVAFDPKVIRCYPVPLKFLTETARKMYGQYQGKSLQTINTTGSTLHQKVREEIESTFGVKIFDSYSCEGGANFSECPECGMYHPAEEYAISEFISDAYSQSDPDKPKRHITTDLVNYATPFIRYDSQDYIVENDAAAYKSCSRPYKQVIKVKGRDSDILRTPSGKYLIVENFVAYFEWIPEVKLIQIRQNSIDQIDINLVVNSEFNNHVYIKIVKYWEDYIGNDVQVKVNVVDDIQLTPTGKRQTVIRSQDIKLSD